MALVGATDDRRGAMGLGRGRTGAARLPGDTKPSSKGFAICSNRDEPMCTVRQRGLRVFMAAR